VWVLVWVVGGGEGGCPGGRCSCAPGRRGSPRRVGPPQLPQLPLPAPRDTRPPPPRPPASPAPPSIWMPPPGCAAPPGVRQTRRCAAGSAFCSPGSRSRASARLSGFFSCSLPLLSRSLSLSSRAAPPWAATPTRTRAGRPARPRAAAAPQRHHTARRATRTATPPAQGATRTAAPLLPAVGGPPPGLRLKLQDVQGGQLGPGPPAAAGVAG
jgi:hypothetical protein